MSRTWNEMNEVNDAGAEKEKKEKEGTKSKGKLRDRLRTRILKSDPR